MGSLAQMSLQALMTSTAVVGLVGAGLGKCRARLAGRARSDGPRGLMRPVKVAAVAGCSRSSSAGPAAWARLRGWPAKRRILSYVESCVLAFGALQPYCRVQGKAHVCRRCLFCRTLKDALLKPSLGVYASRTARDKRLSSPGHAHALL